MPLPAVGPLAKAASKALPYVYKWAPYYAVKFGVMYGVKKYPGGTPGLYRTSLKVVRRHYPQGHEQHQQLRAAVQRVFRVPGQADAALQNLDGAIGDIIRQDAQARHAEGIPDEFTE